jgi:hypothetical protein
MNRRKVKTTFRRQTWSLQKRQNAVSPFLEKKRWKHRLVFPALSLGKGTGFARPFSQTSGLPGQK